MLVTVAFRQSDCPKGSEGRSMHPGIKMARHAVYGKAGETRSFVDK